MTSLRRSLVALSSLLSASILAQAQVSYTGGNYTQNFNTLTSATIGTATNLGGPGPFPLTGTPMNGTPADVTTLAGWSLARLAGTNANALFASGTGSGNAGAVYGFGATNNADRALGTLLSGATTPTVGVVFTNNTGATITQFTLSYTGEQWRYGGTSGTDRLVFEYQINGSSIAAGTFTGVPALDFTSRVHGDGINAGTATALNGNDPANKIAISAIVTGISWPAGQNLVLRWRDTDVTPGADDGLAVDDVTFSADSAPPAAIPPTVTSTIPADAAVNITASSTVSITFNAPATVSGAWFTINGSTSGSHTALVSGGPTTYTLTPAPIFAEGETVTVDIIGTQVKDALTGTAPMAADYPFAFTVQSLAPLPIHTIQGSGTASPYAGQTVSVQGIVTGTYQSANATFGGFYIQAAEADYDGDSATSEGMFVNTTSFPVSIGNVVKVTGTVEERASSGVTSTRLTGVTSVVLQGSAPLPAAASLTLPLANTTAAEPLEGMLVTLPQSLTVTENFDLGHFGELLLSNGRLNTPTNVVAPGAPAIALNAANRLNQIILDDSLDTTYPDPTPFLADSAGLGLTRRAGGTATGVTGVLDHKFGGYIIEPTAAPVFVDANPRGAAPAVTGTLKVAIGNVLNFFNGNGAGGGFPTARGADTFAEYQRQRAKIIAGIIALAPDIMGLTEVENDGYGATSAIADLVSGLNAAAAPGTTYAFVNASAVDIVTDEIHCAFIYRTQTVATVGAPAMLNNPAYNSVARNPLAQTFRQLSNNEKLTISINHFKSKGSASSYPSSALNADTGDGQGASNHVRKLQAQALVDWLATDPTASGDPDFLIIGDLNAYAKEDPISIIEGAGYVNLTEAAEGVGGYSYAFDGAFGHLDHALANGHLSAQVVDAATWHVNSDEPVYYDYNIVDAGNTKTPAQQAINVGGAYRYSDHDPVVVGLNLQPDPATDVTGQLQITWSAQTKNLVTKRHVQNITIKNIGATPLVVPVSVILQNLSPNATFYNPAGYTTVIAPLNSPYFNLNVGADNILSPGESVTRLMEFVNPTYTPITYTIKVVAGPGGR